MRLNLQNFLFFFNSMTVGHWLLLNKRFVLFFRRLIRCYKIKITFLILYLHFLKKKLKELVFNIITNLKFLNSALNNNLFTVF